MYIYTSISLSLSLYIYTGPSAGRGAPSEAREATLHEAPGRPWQRGGGDGPAPLQSVAGDGAPERASPNNSGSNNCNNNNNKRTKPVPS